METGKKPQQTTELFLLKIQHHTHFALWKHQLTELPWQLSLKKPLLVPNLNPSRQWVPLSQTMQNTLKEAGLFHSTAGAPQVREPVIGILCASLLNPV